MTSPDLYDPRSYPGYGTPESVLRKAINRIGTIVRPTIRAAVGAEHMAELVGAPLLNSVHLHAPEHEIPQNQQLL